MIGRRGSSNWSVEVEAKQAHSSGIFRDEVGAGAVFEMARILNRFYGEVRGPFGLTFNLGILAGGTFVEEGASRSDQAVFGKTNVLAQKAIVHARLGFAPAKSFPPERRGAADISFVAPFVTSMDGLGVDGSGAHSPREEMRISSMKTATQCAALLIGGLLSE